MGKDRDVVVVVYDNVETVDVAALVDVFSGANKRGANYRVRLASATGRDITTTAGIRMGPTVDLPAIDALDTLVVVGGFGYAAAAKDAALLSSVRELSARARRTTSVCTGAFVLAAAGLLDGRRATTHWANCAHLTRTYPRVKVDPEPIFVRDGPIITSAGSTAGFDLALALVEEDHGGELAGEIGDWLVLFTRRTGGQPQFSVRARASAVRADALRRLLDAITADPTGRWTTTDMAAHAAISTRHLTRLFADQIGISPAAYVERTRVEAARTLLEAGESGMDAIARACGFGSAESLRRAFHRVLGITPADFRARARQAREE